MRWGLGMRVFVLAVLAPVLTTTLLVGYLLSSRAQDTYKQLVERGETVARQLAPALREPLASEDQPVVHQIAAAARLDPAIATVIVQRADGQVVAHFGAEDVAAQEARPEDMFLRLSGWLLRLDHLPSIRVPVVAPPDPLLDRLPLDSGEQLVGWVLVDVNATPYLQREAVLARRAAAALGLALLFSLGFGFWARRSVVRPIARLTDTVRRLGSGDLRARAHLLASGEIGELARAVNRMAARQQRNETDLNEQIEQATRESRETLEAVEIQNAELDLARKRALQGSKVKSEFLANMSHEIRTPINGILGFTDLLSHTRLNDEQREFVDTIRESCTNLSALVNDILDFSKVEAGKLVIDNVAFDMRDCVEEVMALMAPTAYGKNLELVHLIYQDVPARLFGDPIRIRQVLTNLVHNAVKFTPQGRVVVRVMLEDESDDRVRIRITVTDTGIGLKFQAQEKLFQAFSQADTSITRRFGGAGLGLIISKKLVEQMGGNVGLESEQDKGSTFWFTLECVKQRRANTNARTPAGHNPLAGRQLLLHDTSTLSRLAARHVFGALGLQVRDVEDAETFLSLAKSHTAWDCIVLGLSREELDRGYFRELMARAQRLDASVLILASTVERNELCDLYRLGAQTCLPKVVRRQTLYRELCRVLSLDETPPEWMAPQQSRPPRPEASRTEPLNRLREIRVLVVDDNAINRKLVSTIVGQQGAQVDEAGDGHEAVNRCREIDYALVFMDIHMPRMSGEDAYGEIRGHAQHHGRAMPRIVALTANAMTGERERLMRIGMDECLIKPVTEAQVTRQLRLAAGEAEMEVAELPSLAEDARGELSAELRSLLAAELPEHRRAIHNAYRRGDRAALQDHVHKLNGAAGVCRAERLQQACDALERAVGENRPEDITGGFERVVDAINELMVLQQRSQDGDR
ncbi:ATP-binding protein [Aquisalimonas sp.]|uniref:ATP-binding protein n=1 Tax=Aquisalimonas sp. TaxID=1872621 RepID=UPI0025C4C096|nr:ATP-binding protein [Aquisalimonas sp.]